MLDYQDFRVELLEKPLSHDEAVLALFCLADDWVATTDPDGTVLEYAQRARQMLQRLRAEPKLKATQMTLKQVKDKYSASRVTI